MTQLLRAFKTLFKIPEITPQTFFTRGGGTGTVVSLAFDGRRRACEARRIAANIAKLPELLKKND